MKAGGRRVALVFQKLMSGGGGDNSVLESI